MLTVALVNNMPDTAFSDTEEQFRGALGCDAPTADAELALFTITEIPRAEAVATQIRNRYRDLSELWNSPPDALIVTGTEPVQAQLQYEPYWPYLARLLEWASFTVPSALLSCLAAHASVFLFDGIERVPYERKCSGVFDGDVDPTVPLAAGLPPVVSIPHSRVNDVSTDRMIDAGYSIVVGDGDADVGWSVATRRCENSDFVLCQGHPEYSTHSLLREYRRDVRRSLFGRGTVPYPTPPAGYIGPRGLDAARHFELRATVNGADPVELFSEFPYDEIAADIQNTWATSASQLYANWLEHVRRTHPARA
jgi:homoserine O-succinyltransferase